MSQRPVNLNSKAFCKNSTLIEDHALATNAARPILYSVKNSDRLAIESSRARQNFKTVPKEKYLREFTADFQSSPKGFQNYVSSHSSPISKQNVIPTYAMTQSLRWNPFVETSSIEELTYSEREPHHNCKCANCSSNNCPSRLYSGNERYGSNRANIMTFVDICTMTPRLMDTGCGSSTVPPIRVSEASVSGSDIAVRDTRTNCIVIDPPTNHHICHPIPILKRTRTLCNYHDNIPDKNSCAEDSSSQIYHEAERDALDGGSSRIGSIRSLFRIRKKKKDESDGESHMNKNRRTIYNEGISDNVKIRCPVIITQDKCDFHTRSRTKQRYLDEDHNQIPHSHKTSHSRYHRNCKPKIGTFLFDNDEYHIVPPPLKFRSSRKPIYRKPQIIPCQLPSIRLPKKVLTSQMNTESFIDSNRCEHRFD